MAFIYHILTASIFMNLAVLEPYTSSVQASNVFSSLERTIEHKYLVANKLRPDLKSKEFPKYLDERKVTINGFLLGTKASEIYKKLGKPTRRRKTFSDGDFSGSGGGCDSQAISIYYSGLEIVLLSDEIYRIIDTSARYTTNMGFKVGDNISKAKKVFSGMYYSSIILNNRKGISIPGMVGGGEGVTIEVGADNKIKKIEITYGCP